MPLAFDKGSIVEAFQTELVKHTASNTPCAALMLHRLPQLLQATQRAVAATSGGANVAALALAYARLHDELLNELEQKQLKPDVSEVRALARAIHHGIITTLTSNPARGAAGGGASARGALQDVGDEESEQLELLRNVSHELRTPLQAILGWVSLLKGGQLQPEACARALAAIERNAKLQSELITKVVESGKDARSSSRNS